MSPSQFKSEQDRITKVETTANQKEKGESKDALLGAELKEKHDIFFKQVDGTQKIFESAKKLKDKGAKSVIDKDEKDIKDNLFKVAQSGENILAKTETDESFTTIRQSAAEITAATKNIEKHLDFFTQLDLATESHQFGETESALVDSELAKLNSTDPKIKASFKKETLKGHLENGLGNLETGIETLSKLNPDSPDLKKLQEDLKTKLNAKMKHLTEERISYLKTYEYTTTDQLYNMPEGLKELLAIHQTSEVIYKDKSIQVGDGTLPNIEVTAYGGGYSHLENLMTIARESAKGSKIGGIVGKAKLEMATDKFKEAVLTANKVSEKLAGLKQKDIPADMLAIFTTMVLNTESMRKEAKDKLYNLENGVEETNAAPAFDEIEASYSSGEKSAQKDYDSASKEGDKIDKAIKGLEKLQPKTAIPKFDFSKIEVNKPSILQPTLSPIPTPFLTTNPGAMLLKPEGGQPSMKLSDIPKLAPDQVDNTKAEDEVLKQAKESLVLVEAGLTSLSLIKGKLSKIDRASLDTKEQVRFDALKIKVEQQIQELAQIKLMIQNFNLSINISERFKPKEYFTFTFRLVDGQQTIVPVETADFKLLPAQTQVNLRERMYQALFNLPKNPSLEAIKISVGLSVNSIRPTFFQFVTKEVNGAQVIDMVKTESFYQLSKEQQAAILAEFEAIPFALKIELQRKQELPEDKDWQTGMDLFKSGNWQQAKLTLFAYFQKNQSNPEKSTQINTTRGILEGIMQKELGEYKERLLAMEAAREKGWSGKEGDRPKDHGAFIEIWKLFKKGEDAANSGKYVTIDQVWALFPKPSNSLEKNGIAWLDPTSEQRLLAEPDPEKRKANILNLARSAKEAGLDDLAKKYHDMFFFDKIEQHKKTFTREDARNVYYKQKNREEVISQSMESAYGKARSDFITYMNRTRGFNNSGGSNAWDEKKILGDWEASFKKDESGRKKQVENGMIDDLWTKGAKQSLHKEMTGMPDTLDSSSPANVWHKAYGKHTEWYVPDAKIGAVENVDDSFFVSEAQFGELATAWSIKILALAAATAMGMLTGGAAAAVVAEMGVGAFGVSATSFIVDGAVMHSTLTGLTEGSAGFRDPEAFGKGLLMTYATMGLMKGTGHAMGAVASKSAIIGKLGEKAAAASEASKLAKVAIAGGKLTGKAVFDAGIMSGFSAAQIVMSGEELSGKQMKDTMADNFVTCFVMGGLHGAIEGKVEKSGAKKVSQTKETKAAAAAEMKAFEAATAADKASAKAKKATTKTGESSPVLDAKAADAAKVAVEANKAASIKTTEALISEKKITLAVIDSMISKANPTEQTLLLNEKTRLLKERDAKTTTDIVAADKHLSTIETELAAKKARGEIDPILEKQVREAKEKSAKLKDSIATEENTKSAIDLEKMKELKTKNEKDGKSDPALNEKIKAIEEQITAKIQALPEGLRELAKERRVFELFPENPRQMLDYISQQESPTNCMALSKIGKGKAKAAVGIIADSTQNLREKIDSSSLDPAQKDALKAKLNIYNEGMEQGGLRRELARTNGAIVDSIIGAGPINEAIIKEQIAKVTSETDRSNLSKLLAQEIARRASVQEAFVGVPEGFKGEFNKLNDVYDNYRREKNSFDQLINPELEMLYLKRTTWGIEGKPKLSGELFEVKNGVTEFNPKVREEMRGVIKDSFERLGLNKDELTWMEAHQDVLFANMKEFAGQNPGRLTTAEMSQFMIKNTESLLFQMKQTSQRQLGEHGLRHFTSNINVALHDYAGGMFETRLNPATNGVEYNVNGKWSPASVAIKNIPAEVKMMISTSMLFHDLGYATLGGHKFLEVGTKTDFLGPDGKPLKIMSGFEGTDAHPPTSETMLARDPLMRKVFGENFETVLRAMHSHDQLTTSTDNIIVDLPGGKKFNISKFIRALQSADNLGTAGTEKNPSIVNALSEMRMLLKEMGMLSESYGASTKSLESFLDKNKNPSATKFADYPKLDLKTDYKAVADKLNADLQSGKITQVEYDTYKTHSDSMKLYKDFYERRISDVKAEMKAKLKSQAISQAEYDNYIIALTEFSAFAGINKFMVASTAMSSLIAGDIRTDLKGNSVIRFSISPDFKMLVDVIGIDLAVAQMKKPFIDYTEKHIDRHTQKIGVKIDKLSKEQVMVIGESMGLSKSEVSKVIEAAEKVPPGKKADALKEGLSKAYIDSIHLETLLDGASPSGHWDPSQTAAGDKTGTIKVEFHQYDWKSTAPLETDSPKVKIAKEKYRAPFSFTENNNILSIADAKFPSTPEGYKSLYKNLQKGIAELRDPSKKSGIKDVYRTEQLIESMRTTLSTIEARYAMELADKSLKLTATSETLSQASERLTDPAKLIIAQRSLEKTLRNLDPIKFPQAGKIISELNKLDANSQPGEIAKVRSLIKSIIGTEMISKDYSKQSKEFLSGKAA